MRNIEHKQQRDREIYQEYLNRTGNGKDDHEIFEIISDIPFKIKNQCQCLSPERIRKIVYEQRKAEKNRRLQNQSQH